MISAILPFRNWSLERLQRCIDCLRELSPISEIILVDFGSSERLAAIPGCRVVRVEADRWCLSEANNIGIAEARNDVILKIDADVQLLVGDETLEELAGSIASGQVAFYVLQPTDFQYENGKRSRKRLRPTWGEGCGNLFSRADVGRRNRRVRHLVLRLWRRGQRPLPAVAPIRQAGRLPSIRQGVARTPSAVGGQGAGPFHRQPQENPPGGSFDLPATSLPLFGLSGFRRVRSGHHGSHRDH